MNSPRNLTAYYSPPAVLPGFFVGLIPESDSLLMILPVEKVVVNSESMGYLKVKIPPLRLISKKPFISKAGVYL
jgi:hypothetical protein